LEGDHSDEFILVRRTLQQISHPLITATAVGTAHRPPPHVYGVLQFGTCKWQAIADNRRGVLWLAVDPAKEGDESMAIMDSIKKFFDSFKQKGGDVAQSAGTAVDSVQSKASNMAGQAKSTTSSAASSAGNQVDKTQEKMPDAAGDKVNPTIDKMQGQATSAAESAEKQADADMSKAQGAVDDAQSKIEDSTN
jgi:hypothetical protein